MIEKIRKFVIEKMSDRKCGETGVRRRNFTNNPSKTAEKSEETNQEINNTEKNKLLN